MHKKLLFAVAALGMLLSTSPEAYAAWAKPLPPDEPPVVTFGSNNQAPTARPTFQSEADPLVNVSAGTNRTVPGTFCDGQWQGTFGFTVGGWYGQFAGQLYAAYQDPTNAAWWDGTCVNSPSFDVTAINLIARYQAPSAFPKTFVFQPLVLGVEPGSDFDPFYDPGDPASGLCGDGNATTASCTVLPGGIQCAGPLYSVTWTVSATFALNLPLPIECCVAGPYFAAYYAPTAGALRLGCDNGSLDFDPASNCAGGTISEPACGWFQDFGAGWFEMGKVFEFNFGNGIPLDPLEDNFVTLNHILYSEGYTPDDPSTHCTPGVCDYQWWYEGDAADCVADNPGERQNDCWFANHPIPDFLEVPLNGERPEMWVRFTAVGLDTLSAIEVLMGTFGEDVDMSVRVTVYEAGGLSPVCGKPIPGAVRGFVDFPGAIGGVTTKHYDLSSIPVADRVFGTLNGGPAESFFVSLSLSPGVDPNNNALAPAFGDVIQDFTNTPICVADPHSGAFFTDYMNGGGPQHRYLGEFEIIRGGIERYRHGEIWMDALMCTEQLPAIEADCGAAISTNDQWANYAHDAQRTSASDIRVGDPNQVEAAWANPLPHSVNFASPTVKNDIVYISRDVAVDAFSLTTGAPIGTATGNPEMSVTGLRGNTTIAFVRGIVSGVDRDLAFTGGGTFPAVSAWELGLETAAPPLWSRSGASPPSLSQQNRYGTSLVVDIGGTDVLITGTEPLAGTGRLWAHVAGTGALYPGWATNPVILDAAVKHGPAINGGKLYVGTCIGGSNVSGSLYQINLADGAVDWNFVGVVGEGWPSGVSTEGDFVYGASRDAGPTGYRYKIDVSGALPAVVWTSVQGVGLYGTPTIGPEFVYFPLDAPSIGLLQVDKELGTVARNFAATDDLCGTTVFQIPMHVTLSCDAYIFAGDRAGHWWCLNAVDGSYEWYREFPGVVMGTALASDAAGDDYAVVAVQSGTPSGLVSAYKFNSGSRPRLIQCLYDTQILVALNSGAGQPHSEPGVFTSIGDEDVVFSSYGIADPLPGATASTTVRHAMNNMIEASREFDGYTTIANAASITKRHRLAGLSSESIDGGERTSIDVLRDKMAVSESRNSASRSMAASASAIRTSAVTMNGSGFPYSLTPGSTGDLDWLYDGTGLGRATDVNVIEFTNDDPDFDFDAVNNGSISVAEFTITYVGGCAHIQDTLDFGVGNSELVFNYGGLGFRANVRNFVFASDPVNDEGYVYDMGLYLMGDSTAGIDGGAQVFCEIYDGASNGRVGGFVPNVAPIAQQCGFDTQTNVLLGAKRTGGCPGTPADIFGNIIAHSMSDTDFAAPAGTRLAAIGMDVLQTEVGATDPLYGDFKLIQWEVVNRDAVAKGPIYIGTWGDWDVSAFAQNKGNFSTAANGYYIWDNSNPQFAYGNFDPAHRSTYSGIDPIDPAKRIVVMDGALRQNGFWPGVDVGGVWSEGINETPAYLVDPPVISDKQGWLLNGAMSFGPNGTQKRYQALYGGVDATSSNDAIIDANLQALAKRAARWGGFARGDVNDDGVVDLSDVCWLQGGNYIYPAAYSGDVDADGDNDAADIARLLSYVSGNTASQPEGAWRF